MYSIEPKKSQFFRDVYAVDVRIPADPADRQTTEARTALPPVEFTVTKGTTTTNFAITDRQFPQQRGPTASYRIYFLPAAFSPRTVSYFEWAVNPAAARPSPVMSSALRASGRNVASLVAEISAPGRGTVLNVTDTQFYGQAGWYYCVGVSQQNFETPVGNLVAAP